MSVLDGAITETLEDFQGAQQLLEVSDAKSAAALLALNCEFRYGQVRCRDGFKQMLANTPTGVAVHNMFYWPSKALSTAADSLLYLYFSDTTHWNIVQEYMDDSTRFTLGPFTVSAGYFIRIVAAFMGHKFYIVYLNAAGEGLLPATAGKSGAFASGTLAFNGVTATHNYFLVSGTEPGAGVVTAGQHFFSVILFDAKGHGIPGTLLNGLWDPAIGPVTATGGMNMTVTLTPAASPNGPWPSWAVSLQLCMTPVNNKRKYLIVPGTLTTIATTTTVINITINYSDTELLNINDSAHIYENLLHYDYTAANPFGSTSYPKFVGMWGQRGYWIVNYNQIDTLFVSEVNNPEFITSDRHALMLPEGRTMVMGVVLREAIYIFGPTWTYAFSQVGQFPVDFPPPAHIDSNIGTVSPYGAAVNSAQGRIAVASPIGLYDMDGAHYADKPLSHLQKPEWELIDWSSPTDVQVKDDAVKQIIFVRAKLRDATYVMMAWDYTRGRTWDKVNYSKWTISNLGPIEMCRDPATNHTSLWLGSSNGGRFMRQKSELAGDSLTTLFCDQPDASAQTGIDFQYQTREFPKGRGGGVKNHLAAEITAFGSGPLSITAKSYGGVRSKPLHPITLANPSSKPVVRDVGMQSEGCSLLFSNGAVANKWGAISGLIWYFRKWLDRR